MADQKPTGNEPEDTSDAVRSDPQAADRNREVLKKKAEEGMRNAEGGLPKDQV